MTSPLINQINQPFHNTYGSFESALPASAGSSNAESKENSGEASARRYSDSFEPSSRAIHIPTLITREVTEDQIRALKCKIVKERAKSCLVASLKGSFRAITFPYTIYGHYFGLTCICARATIFNDYCIQSYQNNFFCKKSIYCLDLATCGHLSLARCEAIFCLFSGGVYKNRLFPDHMCDLQYIPSPCGDNGLVRRISNYYYQSMCACCDCFYPTPRELVINNEINLLRTLRRAIQALDETNLPLPVIALTLSYLEPGQDPLASIIQQSAPVTQQMV